MDSNAKEFWHVRAPIERPFVLKKGKTYSYIPELTTVLPIENLPMARVFIRVRNRPPRERDRTGLSREQISFWFADYPKTPGCDVRFGSNSDLAALKCDFRYAPESRHRLPDRPCPKSATSRHQFDFDGEDSRTL